MQFRQLFASFRSHGSRSGQPLTGLAAVLAASAAALLLVQPLIAEDVTTIDQRLTASVKYLASDELEGRGVGTKGLDAAADYIAAQFVAAGLQVKLFDDSPFQRFRMTIGAKLGTNNRLVFNGPPATGQHFEMAVTQDFNPLAMGGSGTFDLPLVFAGYGITAKDADYDDYAGIDAKEKAVIVLRHEPQQDNPHSKFNGKEHSEHAPFSRKVSNAYEHGAAAVIFVTDDFDVHKNVEQFRSRWKASIDELATEAARFKAIDKPSEEQWSEHRQRIDKLADQIKSYSEQWQKAVDPLLPFEGAGTDGEGRDFPVLYVRRSALDKVLRAALDTDLAKLEKQIDEGPRPQSRPLEGWHASGQTEVERTEADVKNVAALLPGVGPLAKETIIVGAHYDHLGRGGKNSADPASNEIHNGADDNASGTAVLLEVARQLAAREKKLPRSILFLAFTGEESGLHGSARYVRKPLVPLDQTIAMLNMDMVGRLADEKLIVHGTGTATEFDPLVDRLGKTHNFQVTKKPGGFGPSDHSSFYAKHMPVLHFFTGSHKDYHRPTDDVEKLNVEGMRRVGQLVTDMVVALAESPERLHFQETQGPAEKGGGGDRPFFGSIPDFSQDQPGYALSGVTQDSPAQRAGLQAGDIIIELGDSRIGNLEDFDSALRKHMAGDKVSVKATRGDQTVKLEVILEAPR